MSKTAKEVKSTKTWTKVVPIVAAAVLLVAGFSFAVSGQSPSVSTSTGSSGSDVDEQYPSYTGSLAAPNDATDAQLAGLAKISADQAKASALNDPTVTGGTVNSVSLDDENGNVVYSVEIVKGSTNYDVKVDAGNGNVLFIEQGSDHESDISETPEATHGAEKEEAKHESGTAQELED